MEEYINLVLNSKDFSWKTMNKGKNFMTKEKNL